VLHIASFRVAAEESDHDRSLGGPIRHRHRRS
jgi:hypothetical protein